jgi:2-polyprenyl-6-methoxyphenol hydroxylase-like FAD-dependent oxidoreductase
MQLSADVVIVGAGPVGLALANLLGARNIDTLVIEREPSLESPARAIGVTPPSLRVLEKLGLAAEIVHSGVQIRRAQVMGNRRKLGEVTFDTLPEPYRFILSIPQPTLESLLEANIYAYHSVRLVRGAALTAVDTRSRTATVRKTGNSKDGPYTLQFRYLCACDGARSTVRSLMSMPFPGRRYRDTFLMGDYFDDSGLGSDAFLFFTRQGSVESFPLPNGKRRWIVQTERFIEHPPAGFLEARVRHRTGYRLSPKRRTWISPFGVQGHIVKSYAAAPVLFAGDAAHLMPPIGGQGMNTGIADAEFLGVGLAALLTGTGDEDSVFRHYNRMRRVAARAALRRARLSMWVGTRRGRLRSGLRNTLLSLLLRSRLRRFFARTFSMLTIPYATLNSGSYHAVDH